MEVDSRPRSSSRSSKKDKSSVKSRSRSRSSSPPKRRSSPSSRKSSTPRTRGSSKRVKDSPTEAANNEGSSASSESPASPDNSPAKRESSSEDEKDDEKEAEPANKSSPEKDVPSQNGTLPEGGDSQKDGHVLDLHPGDMEIGCSSVRSSMDSVQDSEEKHNSHNDVSSDGPQQVQQQQPRNISNRKLSLSGSRDAKPQDNRPQRKRRWGSLTKVSTPSISTESLKDLIPDYKPHLTTLSVLPDESPKESTSTFSAPLVAGDVSGEETSQEPPEKPATNEKEIGEKTEPLRIVQLERRTSNSSLPTDKPAAPSATAPTVTLLPHKGAPSKEEADSKAGAITRSQSPAKNPVSRILYIRNLVRPFTLPQLKEMLARTGSIVPDAFWIDKIKSKCYVMYETEEEAVTTRTALHGARWPVSNPKTLLVDYSTEDELNFHKQLGDSPGLPPPLVPVGSGSGVQVGLKGPGEQQRSEEHFPRSHRLAKNMTVVVSQNVPTPAAGARTPGGRQHREESEKSRSSGDARQNRTQPVREWDRDKLSQDGGHSHHSRHHSHHYICLVWT